MPEFLKLFAPSEALELLLNSLPPHPPETELVRPLEFLRISALRRLSATRPGARLRPFWWRVLRRFQDQRVAPP